MINFVISSWTVELPNLRSTGEHGYKPLEGKSDGTKHDEYASKGFTRGPFHQITITVTSDEGTIVGSLTLAGLEGCLAEHDNNASSLEKQSVQRTPSWAIEDSVLAQGASPQTTYRLYAAKIALELELNTQVHHHEVGVLPKVLCNIGGLKRNANEPNNLTALKQEYRRSLRLAGMEEMEMHLYLCNATLTPSVHYTR